MTAARRGAARPFVSPASTRIFRLLTAIGHLTKSLPDRDMAKALLDNARDGMAILAGGKISGTSDPREASAEGMVAVHGGEGGTLIDTSRAVLVDAWDTCTLDKAGQAAPTLEILALQASGRINLTADERVHLLMLTDFDGIASLIAHTFMTATQCGQLDRLMAAVEASIDTLTTDPATKEPHGDPR